MKSFLNSENIDSIRFAPNSEVRTIEKKAFYGSLIVGISIPSSLIELEENWCLENNYLTNIYVDPKNPRYSIYDDKFIVGKSNLEHENYDILVFCKRDIKSVIIPSFIEIIGSCAFDSCFEIQSIEIPKDSKLRIIESYAFHDASITSFHLPPNVTHIYDRAFFGCNHLQNFEIPNDSKLKIIGRSAFSFSNIEIITIPSYLEKVGDGWCSYINNLKNIVVMPNNKHFSILDEKIIIEKSDLNRDNFDILVYCFKNIESIKIPSFIEIINPFAFNICSQLKEVIISNDSKLKVIGKEAFYRTLIKRIDIPPQVEKIGELAFNSCNELREINILIDSKLQTIEKSVFNFTPIVFLLIPSSLIDLKESWCWNMKYLTKFTVMPNNPRYSAYDNKFIVGKSNLEQENYDILVFCKRDIKSAIIPSFIEIIGSCAFDNCFELQ